MRHWIGPASAGILGAVFIFAAASKASSPEASLRTLRFVIDWVGMPEGWAFDALRMLIVLELALGVVLIGRLWPRGTLWASTVVLGAFTMLAWLLYDVKAPVGCGCGFSARPSVSPGDI